MRPGTAGGGFVTDIKQRLQQQIDGASGIPPLEPDTLQVCRDALAEIEQLRREKSELAQASSEWFRALSAANEKLIARLRVIS